MDAPNRNYTLECVMDALSAMRIGAACTEAELHQLAAETLRRAGIEARHEVRLAPRCRIDFMVGDIGLEIKKKRPVASALAAQLSRYAACDEVRELLVLAPRGVNLPRTIGGKRVTMMGLERLWGISLP